MEGSFPRGGATTGRKQKFDDDGNEITGSQQKQAMTEASFPRGGTGGGAANRKVKFNEDGEEVPQLFKESSKSESPRKTKNKVKEEKGKKATKVKKGKEKEQKPVKPEPTDQNIQFSENLTIKDVTPDMLVLGTVQEVDDFELLVSLPHGLSGKVKITDISDAYTALLQKLSQQGEEAETVKEEVASLQELFRVGQVVRCKVQDVNKAAKRFQSQLSINPKHVNAKVSVNNLTDGMILSGVVSSREDHGYVVDVGVKGITAFLKKKAASKYIEQMNEGKGLQVGQYMDCMVHADNKKALQAGESRTITVSVDPQKVCRAAMKLHMNIMFNSLLPGMQMDAKFEKATDMGIRVGFLGMTGCIHKRHLTKLPSQFTENEEVKAVVLHVHPITKVIGLTHLKHLVNPDLTQQPRFGTLAVGDIIETEDWRIEKKVGIYITLGEDIKAIAYPTQLSDKPGAAMADVCEKGKPLRCRVLGFLHTDNLVLVTLKQSILEQKFLNYKDIKPGDIVQCTVRSVHQRGVAVQMGRNIRGFIPQLHLADFPVSKTMEKRFSEGDSLKCRVLAVKPEEMRVILTNKKSLLKSSCPVVTSYEELKEDDKLDGYIVKILEHGVIVAFFNNIKGWVPRAHLSAEPVEFPDKVFYEGQVVKCRVLSVNVPESKMRLSLIMDGMTPLGAQKEADVPEDFKLGRIVSCKVDKKTESGLDVIFDSSGKKGFLPLTHLHDDVSICGALLETYKPGDVIDKVVYYSKKMVMVSRKAALISAAEDGSLITDIAQLMAEMVVVGCVHKVADFGLFVRFAGGFSGLVPNRLLSEREIPDPREVFTEDQTVFTKVLQASAETGRVLLSLRMHHCHVGGIGASMDVLDNHLNGLRYLREQYMSFKGVKGELASMQVGDIREVTVTEVTEHGALCALEGKVKGFVMYEHMKDRKLEAGMTTPMVVLHVDWPRKLVELGCTKYLLEAVQAYVDNKYSQVKPGQTMQSEVFLIRDEFALVMLKGAARGKLAYVPTRQIYNDVFGRRPFVIGQINGVRVKRVGAEVRACLRMYEQDGDESADHDETAAATVKQQFKMGHVTTGVVTQVEDHHVCLRLADTDVIAHAHVTQLEDDVEEGTNPMSAFKEGKSVKVRVIGLNRDTTPRMFPISLPRKEQTSIEVTTKSSVLKKPKLAITDKITYNMYKVRKRVNAYFMTVRKPYLWFMITPRVFARVLSSQISDDIQVCNNPEKHFKTNVCYKAKVTRPQVKNVLEITFRKSQPVKVDTVVLGTVMGRCGDTGLIIHVAEEYQGLVHVTDVSDEYEEDILARHKCGDVVECYVLDARQKHRLILSLRQSRTQTSISKVKDREVLNASQLRAGLNLRGFVKKVESNEASISLGLDVVGMATVPDETTLTPGQCVVTKVLSVQEDFVSVGLRDSSTTVPEADVQRDTALLHTFRSRTRKESESEQEAFSRKRTLSWSEDDASAMSPPPKLSKAAKRSRQSSESKPEESNKKNSLRLSIGDDVIWCGKRGQKRTLAKRIERNIKKQESKEEKTASKIKTKATPEKKIGAETKLGISATEKQKVDDKGRLDSDSNVFIIDSTVKSDVDTAKQLSGQERDENANEADVIRKKKRKTSERKTEESMETEESQGVKTTESERLNLSTGFSWSDDFELPSVTPRSKQTESDYDSDSEEMSDDVETKKPVKPVTEKEEEHQIYKRERELLDAERTPVEADDFERLVLQSPNSSLVWLRFMAHHLEHARVDKARFVAERALKTISFREEQEKLNVWVALLNLENMYGSPESLREVFDRALQYNDPYKVYTQLINIYVTSGKMEAAEQLYGTCIKKFSQRKEVWINYGTFLFQAGRLVPARKLLPRCFQSLDAKEHAEVISKFAQFEFKYGEANHGVSMFENVLSTYPKRTDLWTVYIDIIIKSGDIEAARKLHERVTDQSMPAKKMKFCLKKYVEFEERHGTSDTVARVKQKAIEYVQNKGMEL